MYCCLEFLWNLAFGDWSFYNPVMQHFHIGGDDEETADPGAPAPDESLVQTGDYDPGDDIGERIGEHSEDPSL